MKQPNNQKNHVTSIDERRMRVANMYLKGYTQMEIAHTVGMSQATVCLDLKAIRELWLAEAVEDFDRLKADELAKIDHMEREAWRNFQLSCQPRKDDEDKGPRPGDKTWLTEVVQWCIDTRLKLFGLYKQPDQTNKQENNFFVQWDKLFERQQVTDPFAEDAKQIEARSLEHNTATVIKKGAPTRKDIIETERKGNIVTPKVQGAPAAPRKGHNIGIHQRNGGG